MQCLLWRWAGRTWVLCAILPLILALMLSAQSTKSPRQDLALVGASIYVSPADEPIPDGTIVIHDGVIAAVGRRTAVQIPASARVLDCSGATITAGFWNSHVHFFERKWANAAAIPPADLNRQLQEMVTRYGFTSVFDLGSSWENTRHLRDRIESGEVPGPRIHSTGEPLVPPGALPSDTVVNLMGLMKFPAPEVADAKQATAASAKLLEEGVDGIKLFASAPRGGRLPDSAMQAAVDEAHRSGKPVFVHPNDGVDVLNAVRAGVDVVAHTTPHSGPWDKTTLDAMHEHHVALTPTLTLWKYYARHDRVSDQDQLVDTELTQLRAWLEAGGTVLFGNDLGAVPYDPSEEYALMARAGMNFRQILASLTTAPAERFGESQRVGRIAEGQRADIVVLKEGPEGNPHAFAEVKYTVRDGKVIFQASQ